jgi:hypothetical protein
MACKLSLHIRPHPLTGSLFRLLAADPPATAGPWGPLLAAARDAREPLRQEAQRVELLLEEIAQARPSKVQIDDPDPDTVYAVAEGFVSLKLVVDLEPLVTHEPEAARALFELIEVLRASAGHACSPKISRSWVSLEEARATLDQLAFERGLILDKTHRPDVDFGDESEDDGSTPASPRPATSEAPRGNPYRDAEDETPFPPRARPAPPAEEPKGKKGKKARPRKGTGSFGNLEDDPTPPPGPTRPRTSPAGQLSDAASFFLSYTRLQWPCGPIELRIAFRQVVSTAHPDRNLNDPSAHHRFVLLTRGHDELQAQIVQP